MSTEKTPETASSVSDPPTAPTTPQTPPELSPKIVPSLDTTDSKPSEKPIYTMDSLTATVLALRQSELYGSPGMNMYGDIFASTQIEFASRLAGTDAQDTQWRAIIRDYSDEFIRKNKIQDVEKAIIAGIPTSLRPLIYLKTMRVRNHMEESSYASVVKKAKLAEWENTSMPETSIPDDLAELMRVYDYCIREVTSTQQAADVTTKRFVSGIFPIVASLPGLSKPEMLALLFKFGAFINRTSKDEFYYKCSRALEDVESRVFLHIVKQGIDLNQLYKSVLRDLFSLEIDHEVLLRILDLIVFEGIDVLVRVTAALFNQHSARILEINNNDLSDLIFSDSFISSLTIETIRAATETEVPLIKYENEFHLISANAISGNDNELSNLKDANEDLLLRISDMKLKIENLKKTHAEILGQGNEYALKLLEAQQEKQKLILIAEELQAKYAHLTMKENLSNTIQANKDISSGNADLEAQIAVLERKVASRKAKLEKLVKS